MEHLSAKDSKVYPNDIDPNNQEKVTGLEDEVENLSVHFATNELQWCT